jgi:general secretion pathway protein G
MRLKTTKTAGRVAFTLVELLVVLSIIILLVSLTAAAVLKFLVQGPTVTTRTEISQLETAIQNFLSNRKVDYIPSRIKLCKVPTGNNGYDLSKQLDKDSYQYLHRIFPQLDDATWGNGIDWNGKGNANPSETLEGDQCLVFFLGGIPATNPNTSQGFSTNPRNPADLNSTANRIGPFYEFKSNRLRDLRGNGYFSYLDGFGKSPYAYFSSYKSRNGYNRYFTVDAKSDCSALGVWPYALGISLDANGNGVVRYQKPDSYQIISAGNDNTFGSGTLLTLVVQKKNPVTFPTGTGVFPPNNVVQLPAEAKDDMSNFSPGVLDAGQ